MPARTQFPRAIGKCPSECRQSRTTQRKMMQQLEARWGANVLRSARPPPYWHRATFHTFYRAQKRLSAAFVVHGNRALFWHVISSSGSPGKLFIAQRGHGLHTGGATRGKEPAASAVTASSKTVSPRTSGPPAFHAEQLRFNELSGEQSGVSIWKADTSEKHLCHDQCNQCASVVRFFGRTKTRRTNSGG